METWTVAAQFLFRGNVCFKFSALIFCSAVYSTFLTVKRAAAHNMGYCAHAQSTNTSKREELGKDGVEGLLGDEASRTFVLYMGDTIKETFKNIPRTK